jgi:integrase
MPRERRRLTKRLIEQATVPPGKAEIWLRDSIVPGLVVRCLSGGTKTFMFWYRPEPGGRRVKKRWVRIGSCSALTLDDARAVARIHAGEVAKGKDPARERAEERRRSRATLSKLLAEDGPYELNLKERGLVNIRPALSSLRRELKDHMTTDVAALSRGDIVAAIDALIRIGKRGAAADLRKFSRSFCEWAVAQGLARFNPMAGLRAPSHTRQQRLLLEQKGKALSDREIVAVWRAAQTMVDRAARGEPVTGTFGGLVQLALLTGLRRGELAQLEHYRHILTGERAVTVRGIEGERIHLPKTITKTAADHDIALTPLMRTVIAAQPRTTSALLFPSRITGGRLKNWTDLVTSLQRDASVDLRLHDLRRTARTLMSRLGVAEDVAELAIGHQRADLVARYNKDAAWPQRTEAFARVSQHIASLLVEAADERSNVVALRHEPRPVG